MISNNIDKDYKPPSGPRRSPPESQTVGLQETLYGPTPAQQAVPSQLSEINSNTLSVNQSNTLSDLEIKILKTKISSDNNLDGLLSLENRIEPGISETIDTRLERDNLVQEAPGVEINLAHLPENFKDEFNKLFLKYSEAFSTDRFDIGLFTGFGQGINLDVLAGNAFQKERPIKGVDAESIDSTIRG